MATRICCSRNVLSTSAPTNCSVSAKLCVYVSAAQALVVVVVEVNVEGLLTVVVLPVVVVEEPVDAVLRVVAVIAERVDAVLGVVAVEDAVLRVVVVAEAVVAG
eukprot:5339421-Amphidinium_carterae.1